MMTSECFLYRYALEMHIEHKSANGDIAMLAVFFTQGSNPSSFLEQVSTMLHILIGSLSIS